jgi:hypothetical protein
MAKKELTPSANAELPPTLVIGSFLKEQKRDYVTKKLIEFGLVRKEYFDKKLKHQRKDFPFKKFFGRRYRFITAPLTDDEVESLFEMIRSLITIKTKDQTSALFEKLSSVTNGKETQVVHPIALKPSFISMLLFVFGLVAFGGGGYLAYTLFIQESLDLRLEFTILVGTASVFIALIFFALARILRIVKSLRR